MYVIRPFTSCISIPWVCQGMGFLERRRIRYICNAQSSRQQTCLLLFSRAYTLCSLCLVRLYACTRMGPWVRGLRACAWACACSRKSTRYSSTCSDCPGNLSSLGYTWARLFLRAYALSAFYVSPCRNRATQTSAMSPGAA